MFLCSEGRQAAEMMLIGSSIKVAPVVQWDGQPIGDGKPSPITKKLLQLWEGFALSDGSAGSRALRVDSALILNHPLRARRIIAQHRSEPTLYLCNRHPFSHGIGFHLVFANGADCEVVGFLMSEIEPAH